MDPALQWIVFEKLAAEEQAARALAAAPKKKGRPSALRPEGWDDIVLAALEGPEALEQALDAPARASADPAARPVVPAPGAVPGTFVRQVRVQGFRGIGPEARLDLNPGPGLTLVLGRNGSGKSSFAEALELLLTGDTFRWAQRTAVWREGWRNLHQRTGARIGADFAVEGEKAGLTISCAFADGAGLGEAETRVSRPGQSPAPFASLGWEGALAAWRPFLSYSELGTTFDTPSELHDRLAQILGLEQLAQAQKALADARLARSRPLDDATKARLRLLDALAGQSDVRASTVRAALAQDDWGLDAIEARLAGVGESTAESDLGALRQLAALTAPAADAVAQAVARLRESATRADAAAGGLAARSLRLADFLDHALRFHEAEGDGPCPVCGRAAALTADWHRERAAEALHLRAAALAASEARDSLAAARAGVAALTPVWPAAALARAGALGLDVDALIQVLAAWQAALLAAGIGGPASEGAVTTDAIAPAAAGLRLAVAGFTAAAAVELSQREDAWRPLARQLAEWLPLARRSRAGALPLPRLEAAEKWLKEQGRALRQERFAPIAKRAIAIWERLRLQSNVELKGVALEGGSSQRRVALDVAVDGEDSVALGVMSQGEIHALALSLFLPRATLPESPFRFLVIDDPVQSMDPARVDGLARVLDEVARERQVIVFTHDDRLAESVRRLGLDASIFAVTRREGSQVEVTPNADPVSRAIGDALALAKTEGLPPAAARRVVPGLCRHALEAACMEAVRRRRLGRGDAHDDVQVLLGDCTTRQLAALALFDDALRAGDVVGRINKERSSWADAFRWCNDGAHEEQAGPLEDRIRDVKALAQWLGRL